ncbi:hypothetical protein P3T76_007161 [Phytophthora citrophthora]|uniref:Uncharacterized protein n=1 Tax=Phytophthora citrophthora TaxID=4793 RepID=A0AAD9GMS3_9STRA|nr:hypothetical protein P3T76_007161 [Phytophthora citrophthora]
MPKIEPFGEKLIEWNAKHRLTMVQTTISQTHPVNASGMLKVLDKLGLMEEVKVHPERVALILLCQNQKSLPRMSDRTSLQNAINYLPGTTAAKLKKRNISSVDQLREEIVKGLKVVSEAVKERLNNLRGESNSLAMAKIPQFVCCLHGEV